MDKIRNIKKSVVMFPGIGYSFTETEIREIGSFLKKTGKVTKDIIGYDPCHLWQISGAESPQRELAEQIINFQIGLAKYKILQESGRPVDLLIGHSSGLYTSLVAAGALTLETALQLISEASRTISPIPGRMLSVLGYKQQELTGIFSGLNIENEVWIAIQNNDIQYVLSGTVNGITKIQDYLSKNTIFRSKLLPVSSPIHCPLLKSNISGFLELIDSLPLKAPRIPAYDPSHLRVINDENDVRKGLRVLLTGKVHWYQSILNLAGQGYRSYIEAGAGKMLTNVVRWISRDLFIEEVGWCPESE